MDGLSTVIRVGQRDRHPHAARQAKDLHAGRQAALWGWRGVAREVHSVTHKMDRKRSQGFREAFARLPHGAREASLPIRGCRHNLGAGMRSVERLGMRGS